MDVTVERMDLSAMSLMWHAGRCQSHVEMSRQGRQYSMGKSLRISTRMVGISAN
jgi:hypothetical protein